KVFREERERPVLLVTDLRSSMNFGTRRALKRVVAADISALLAWAAAMQGDRVGGLIFNDTNEFDLRPHTGRKTLMAYLHRLAEMPVTEAAAAQPRMLDICRHLARVARPGSAVYIVSDWQGFDKECERALYSVSRHCDLIAIRVIDPLEIQKPAGDYVLTDGRQRSRLSISSRDSAEQLTAWQERTNQLKHSLLHLQAPLIDVQTHEDPLDCLRQGMGFTADLSGVTV
ncbi:MAG: DUF58 domain-containing protein, partial [Oceanospirillaceae bacterium]|nr:DUF58 domain-containing protein [Oceanospirillaceae bacterium]